MWWPMQDYFSLVHDRDANQPFPDDYACKGLLSFLKLRKSKDYSSFCEGFHKPANSSGPHTNLAQPRLHFICTSQGPIRSDPCHLGTFRQDAALYPQGCGFANLELRWIPRPVRQLWKIQQKANISNLQAESTLNVQGQIPLNAPRSLAFAKDGTFYVADSRNHRILHLDTQGNILHQWGSFADGVNTPVAPGTFNEPWGVAVGPDGSVYATDTWNHRIEKFTSTGKYITSWGILAKQEHRNLLLSARISGRCRRESLCYHTGEQACRCV